MVLPKINTIRRFFYEFTPFLIFWVNVNYLSHVFLPAKVRIIVQPEVKETELWCTGPIFSLLIVAWSFSKFAFRYY